MKVHNPNNLPTIPIADLLPTQGNLKDLTEKNYNKLKGRIEHRGFSVPVYVWEDDKGVKHLLDGHQRRQVLTTEGWNDPIPYLKIPAKDLQEAMARLLEITSQYATITQEGIDEFMATYELNEAEVYEATSFDALGSYGSEEEPEIEEDEAPEVDESEPPKSKLGEIYQLGRHRVMCGDSVNAEDAKRLMGKQKAEMTFTDPPYLMGFEGNVHGDGSKSFNATHGAIKNDKMSKEEGDNFIYSIFETLHTHVNGAYYVCFYRLGLDYIFRALDKLENKHRAVIIWDKGNHTLSNSDYMSKYEPIVYGWFNDHNFYGGRSNFDIWNINRTAKNELHPTMKPIELCAKAIQNSSKKDDIVLDLFLGSGSTLIACEQTDRTCYGLELDEKYLDVIRKRWAKYVYPDRWEEEWEELTPVVK